MKTPKITAKMLRRHKACPEQVKIFKREWPDGATLTLENLHRAITLDLDVCWLECLLTGKALVEYEGALQLAKTEYDRVRQPAWAEYDRVRQPAWAEYDRVRQLARTEYDKAWQSARAEYEKVRDRALLRALRAQLKEQSK